MPIISADIKYRLSGGAANTDPLAALGGAASTTDAAATIFDNVSSAEASTGESEYRCVYVKNTHATLTAIGTKVWVQTQTPSADTDVAIGLGTSAVNGNEQTVADENTAPAGVSFTAPAAFAAGLTIGDLTPGQTKAVWVKRTVNAGAAPTADSFVLRSQCDTLP